MFSTRKVFVLGRTGSGKSTTVHLLTDFVRQHGWTTEHFDDYPILRKMFLADTEERQFRPTENDGFEVTDPDVFDTALKELEKEIRHYEPVHEKTLIAIEFSRNNYYEALKSFSSDFLRDTYYFFVAADLPTCLQRISKRGSQSIIQSESAINNDFFVKDTVLFKHFPCPYMPPSINRERVTFIQNIDSLEDLEQCVKKLAATFPAPEQELLLSAVS